MAIMKKSNSDEMLAGPFVVCLKHGICRMHCTSDCNTRKITDSSNGNQSDESEYRIEALKDAAKRLECLAERWEETTVWHNPPFLEGRIYITTGDLRDITTVVRGILRAGEITHNSAYSDGHKVRSSNS